MTQNIHAGTMTVKNVGKIEKMHISPARKNRLADMLEACFAVTVIVIFLTLILSVSYFLYNMAQSDKARTRYYEKQTEISQAEIDFYREEVSAMT